MAENAAAMKRTFSHTALGVCGWLLGLALLGCGQTPPGPSSSASPRPVSTPAVAANEKFSDIQGEQVTGLSVAPFSGHSVALNKLTEGKLGSGALVPLMESKNPENVLLGLVPGAKPEELDARNATQQLVVSGVLKPIEDDALVAAIEKEITGKLWRREGKAFYVELAQDPWPAATPLARETP